MHRYLRVIADVLKGKPLKARSSEWHKVEKEHLAQESVCQWCGAAEKLQVHHIKPFHLYPKKELDPDNLITLCEEGPGCNHHLDHGHNGNFRDFNMGIREECKLRGPFCGERHEAR